MYQFPFRANNGCLNFFQTELVPAGLPPLEELLKRLKEGMFNDVLAVLYPGCNEDITIIAKLLNTNMLQIPLVSTLYCSKGNERATIP